MRRCSFLLLGCLGTLPALGCEFGEGDARVPGEPLGTFQVHAEILTSDCGSGAMGSTDVWEFEVMLSRDHDQLFWLNGREVISGGLASDGRSFEFDTRVQVEVLEPEPGRLGCTLTRLDRASGKLGLVDDEVESFGGRLTFSYIPGDDSDCSPLIGVEAGFSALPCAMSYELEAVRLDEPTPE